MAGDPSPYRPHKGTWLRIPLDLVLSLALVWLIARSRPHQRRIWAPAIAGVIPDADTVLLLFPDPDLRAQGGLVLPAPIMRFVRWHEGIQRETASLWGLVPQVAAVLVGLPATRPRPSGARWAGAR